MTLSAAAPALAAVFLLSLLLTGLIRRSALRRGLLDHPNARSSHTTPTPRGGGLALLLPFLAFAAWLRTRHLLDASLFAALAAGILLVGGIGWIDDRRPLGRGLRLLVHLLAAALALVLLDLYPASPLLAALTPAARVLLFLAGIALFVWCINLYNFMDGIDGLAASQAVFVSLAGAYILHGHSLTGLSLASLALAAACLGFLFWNRPPARIFMGDVGSAALGFVFALWMFAALRLRLVHAPNDPIAAGDVPWLLYRGLRPWSILLALFVADASVTLLRRILRGGAWWQAHRSHAYQRLARHRGHAFATRLYLALNLLLVLPLVLFDDRGFSSFPASAFALYLLLAFAALASGAGRDEKDTAPPPAAPPQGEAA